MKINKHPLLLFFFLFISYISFSQTKTNPKSMSTVEIYTHAVDQYLQGLNEKNLEGILSLYANNATLEDPVGSTVIEGITNIREFYLGAVKLDLMLKRTGPVRIAAKEAAFPFQLKMNVQGKTMQTDIIDIFRFDEQGKIVSMRAFWGPSNQTIVGEEK